MISSTPTVVSLFEANGFDGPTRAELEAIDAEWPLIAAEIALVDAEARAALHPTEVTEAAVEAAQAAVATISKALAIEPHCPHNHLPNTDLKEVS